MKFQYLRNPHLPKLAWLASISRDSQTVLVYAGSKVECHEGFFVTGVWDGAFSEAGFDRSDVFYGTGAKLSDSGVRFYTPAHALERLCLVEENDRIVVSNSVPFIMAYCGLETDDTNDQYEYLFCSILKGSKKYTRYIPMKDGRTLQHFIFSEITVTNDGKLTVAPRQSVKPFADYNEYYSRMMASMTAVRENATSAERRNSSFGVVSTVTKGYDSCANATIARHIGGETVVSLAGGVYDTDCGADVAEQLGYPHIVRKHKDDYKAFPDCIDAEYNASGETAKHQQFVVFEEQFKDNLVFMGTRGDYYWSLDSVANNHFEMIGFHLYETDISYTENALKNGYIVIAMATYGVTAATSIQAISRSEEMYPWRLGTAYDRPIPRRIVESAGVDREAFGQQKYGGGFCYCHDTVKTLEGKMSRVGYQAFREFLAENPRPMTVSRLWHTVKYYVSILPTIVTRVSKMLHLPIVWQQTPPTLSNPGAPADLVRWSITVMKERYQNAMDHAE